MNWITSIFRGWKRDIVEEFESHAATKQWGKALPLIEEIIRRAPEVSTSWRNYGVCLDELSQYREASTAFKRAYELNPDDLGSQYRTFRSLALTKESQGFIAFAESEAGKMPEILDHLRHAEEFKAIVASAEFQNRFPPQTGE